MRSGRKSLIIALIILSLLGILQLHATADAQGDLKVIVLIERSQYLQNYKRSNGSKQTPGAPTTPNEIDPCDLGIEASEKLVQYMHVAGGSMSVVGFNTNGQKNDRDPLVYNEYAYRDATFCDVSDINQYRALTQFLRENLPSSADALKRRDADIGQALLDATKRIEMSDKQRYAVVLLSGGEINFGDSLRGYYHGSSENISKYNRASEEKVNEAIRYFRDTGIPLYTIGLDASVPNGDLDQSSAMHPREDLRTWSEETGGLYSLCRNAEDVESIVSKYFKHITGAEFQTIRKVDDGVYAFSIDKPPLETNIVVQSESEYGIADSELSLTDPSGNVIEVNARAQGITVTTTGSTKTIRIDKAGIGQWRLTSKYGSEMDVKILNKYDVEMFLSVENNEEDDQHYQIPNDESNYVFYRNWPYTYSVEYRKDGQPMDEKMMTNLTRGDNFGDAIDIHETETTIQGAMITGKIEFSKAGDYNLHITRERSDGFESWSNSLTFHVVDLPPRYNAEEAQAFFNKPAGVSALLSVKAAKTNKQSGKPSDALSDAPIELYGLLQINPFVRYLQVEKLFYDPEGDPIEIFANITPYEIGTAQYAKADLKGPEKKASQLMVSAEKEGMATLHIIARSNNLPSEIKMPVKFTQDYMVLVFNPITPLLALILLFLLIRSIVLKAKNKPFVRHSYLWATIKEEGGAKPHEAFLELQPKRHRRPNRKSLRNLMIDEEKNTVSTSRLGRKRQNWTGNGWTGSLREMVVSCKGIVKGTPTLQIRYLDNDRHKKKCMLRADDEPVEITVGNGCKVKLHYLL